MKNVIILLFMVITYSSYGQAKDFIQYGELARDGSITLTVDESTVLAKWSAILKKESRIDAKFTKLEIVKIDDFYNLKASGANISSSLYIENNNGTFGFRGGAPAGTSCTSTGCTGTDCTPRTWLVGCKSCPKTCTQTVSNAFHAMLTST